MRMAFEYWVDLGGCGPTARGPRPKGTESSGTLHTALCKPSQPSQPVKIRAAGSVQGGLWHGGNYWMDDVLQGKLFYVTI